MSYTPTVVSPAELEKEIRVERIKAVIQFALAAIQGVILVNGGAAVAILAFLGNIWQKDNSLHPMALAITWPLELFLCGVTAGVATAAMGYLAQLTLAVGSMRFGNLFRVLAMLCVVVGVGAFFWGSVSAASAFAKTLGSGS
jgi:hypothetical protein